MTVETKAPVKPWRFSATAAEIAQDCMYAFSQRYEMGVQEIPSRPLHVGRLMAMTVERYQLHCFEHGVPSDVTEIETIARRVYAEAGQGAGLDVLDEVLRVCEFYVESYALDIERLAGVEMWLPPTGADPLLLAGREVVGKLDQLLFDDEGRLAVVIDQKTNWHVWTDEETRASLQARLYPVMILHAFPGVEEVEVRFQFIRWGMERSVRVTRGEAYREREKLEALAALMQKPGPRPATPGARCGFCGYVSVCPVFKSARQNGVFIVPTNEEEAQKVHETVLVLEAALDQRRKALNAFTREHGTLETRGEHVGHFRQDTRKVLTKTFREWAKENGVDPDEWLVVPPRELERLMKKRHSLEPLTYIESKTRFGTRKHVADSEDTTAA